MSSSSPPTQPSEYRMIDAPCGEIRARVTGGLLRARGIPYATAARFTAPQAAPRWTTPLHADEECPACPQPRSPLLERMFGDGCVAGRQDEECQRLSVTSPAEAPSEPAPVMIWIHGGSYTSGSGDARLTDPSPLVEEQGVIVVTVTYRLGILGYLGDGEARPANLGLLDQLSALRWVQENIAAFGGNPESVTVFGQSAGADAIAQLMALPEAPQLFRRAIMQSAPDRSPGDERVTRALVAATADITSESSIPEVLEAQRRAQRAAATFGLSASMPFRVQYDRHPLPSWEECERGWARNAPQIDLLIGNTADEARFFIPAIPALARATAIPVLGPVLRRIVSRSLNRPVYARPSRRFARAHAEAGGRGARYRLTWPGAAGRHGAAHTVDLALLFGSADDWSETELLGGTAPERIRQAGVRVRGLWAEFARTGRLSETRLPRLISVRALDS